MSLPVWKLSFTSKHRFSRREQAANGGNRAGSCSGATRAHLPRSTLDCRPSTNPEAVLRRIASRAAAHTGGIFVGAAMRCRFGKCKARANITRPRASETQQSAVNASWPLHKNNIALQCPGRLFSIFPRVFIVAWTKPKINHFLCFVHGYIRSGTGDTFHATSNLNLARTIIVHSSNTGRQGAQHAWAWGLQRLLRRPQGSQHTLAAIL